MNHVRHSIIVVLALSFSLLSACGGGDNLTTITQPQNNPPANNNPPGNLPPPSNPTEPQTPVEPQSNYSLFMQQGIVTILASPDTGNGATVLNVWGFSDVESLPAGKRIIPGTALNAEVNKPLTISVKNNLAVAHNFSFVILPDAESTTTKTTPIASGATANYTVTPKNSGIYLYSDAMANGINQSLGLYGVMIVRPAMSLGKVVWSDGPSFDKEVTWVIADLDYTNYNLKAIAGNAATIGTATYKANYFLMNGMNGFQAMGDPATTIQGVKDETVLVRIANAGQYSQSLHFHGNHFQVISRNGVRVKDSEIESLDTINIKPNQTAMVLYTIDQLGHYPMHVHTAQMEAGGGVYLNGTAAMIIGK